MGADVNQIVFSKPAVEFATVAKEYCAFIENATNFKRSQFVKVASSLLPLLYYKASLLPLTEPIYDDGNQKFVTEEYYTELYARLKGYMGEHDSFPEVFDPRVSETDEGFSASLAEYITDVYQDLKDFSILFQKGYPEEMHDALWECSLNFREFWGVRLANAIRAFHLLAYGDADLDEQPADIETKKSDVDTSNWIITKIQNPNDSEL
jgi:hypothetical protein